MSDYNLTPAELKAIEEHKFYMSTNQKRNVSIQEAIDDFIANYKKDWEKEKLRRENYEQKDEIEKHKYLRSKEAGQDIGELAAAEEWRNEYAEIWRKEQESLEKHEFCCMKVVVQNEKGMHMRPTGRLAALADKYDCDVYVHKEGMEIYNFILNNKKYLNVKSVLGLLTLAAPKDTELEFITIGKDAIKLLDAIKNFDF
ncbi:MAG: HPr family phosphocarrier protein [Nitrospirota bacterium]